MRKINKEKIKTWLVTGASSGVGNVMVKELLKREYNVIAVSRRLPDFKHENVLSLSVDVTYPDSIRNAIYSGIEKFGTIDVLVNNAGITSNITLEEESVQHIKEVMETNFFGTFNTIHAILPYFRQSKNGTIVNNTSQSGLAPRGLGSAYCSSKHAIEGLTGVAWLETYKFCRVMAFELGGFPETGIFERMLQVNTNIEEYKNLKNIHKNIYNIYENNLESAVSCIIDTVENETLPRRLILGKDACAKVDAEIKWLKKDIEKSKKLTKKCSKYKPDLIVDLIIRFLKKIKNKIF